jgi:NADH:ubiquinone oxidoreductase subunit
MTIGTRLYTLFHGRLVGADSAGNRYYSRRISAPNPDGRREERWVLYKDSREASRISAEWHSWLHYTTDTPLSPDPAKTWRKEHQPNPTGSAQAYLPPGHDLMGGKREKAPGDYQAWTP